MNFVTMNDITASENPVGELVESIEVSCDGVIASLKDVTMEGLQYLQLKVEQQKSASKKLQERYDRDRKTRDMSNISFAKVPNSIGVYEIIKNRYSFMDYNSINETTLVDRTFVEKALKEKERVAVFESKESRILLASNFMIE